MDENDYYPYGMLQPGRHQNTGDYRYGFAGMELDNELKGEGNSYDFGARMYDARLGRWFAEDPLAIQYPMYSPYGYAANSPLVVLDSDGESIIFWLFKKYGITTKEAAIKVLDSWGIENQDARNTLLFIAGMASGSADMNIVDTAKGMFADGNQFVMAYKTIRNLTDLDWDETNRTEVLRALVSATPVPGIVEPFTELYKDYTEEGRDIDWFESGKNTIIAATTVVAAAEGLAGYVKPKIKISSNSRSGGALVDDLNLSSTKPTVTMTGDEFFQRGSVQKKFGTKKGVYKFVMEDGSNITGTSVYVGKAGGLKGLAGRIKNSWREIYKGTKKAAPKNEGARLKKVEFYELDTNVHQGVNALERQILEEAGGIRARDVLNARNAPSTNNH